VEIQKGQVSGRYGIIFYTSRFTVTPTHRHRLTTLYFHEARTVSWELGLQLSELYDRMLAKDLPCVMTVVISKPLTRQQGDLLNEQRTDIAILFSSIVGGIASSTLKLSSLWATRDSRKFAQERLRTYHAGDVIVGVEAHVSGGIGPQRTVTSMLIPTPAG